MNPAAILRAVTAVTGGIATRGRLILIFPSLDPLWVVPICAMLALWAIALKRDSIAASIAFGATLALVTLFVYNVLVIGTLVLAYAAILPPR